MRGFCSESDGEENGNYDVGKDRNQIGAANTPTDQGHMAERCTFSSGLSLRTTPCGRAARCIVCLLLQVTPFNGISSHLCLLTQMEHAQFLGRISHGIRFEYEFEIKSQTHFFNYTFLEFYLSAGQLLFAGGFCPSAPSTIVLYLSRQCGGVGASIPNVAPMSGRGNKRMNRHLGPVGLRSPYEIPVSIG